METFFFCSSWKCVELYSDSVSCFITIGRAFFDRFSDEYTDDLFGVWFSDCRKTCEGQLITFVSFGICQWNHDFFAGYLLADRWGDAGTARNFVYRRNLFPWKYHAGTGDRNDAVSGETLSSWDL